MQGLPYLRDVVEGDGLAPCAAGGERGSVDEAGEHGAAELARLKAQLVQLLLAQRVRPPPPVLQPLLQVHLPRIMRTISGHV